MQGREGWQLAARDHGLHQTGFGGIDAEQRDARDLAVHVTFRTSA